VISSVSLDHATPASLLRQRDESRPDEQHRALSWPRADTSSSAAAALVAPEGQARSAIPTNNVWDLLSANGYTVLNDRASILALKNQPIDKVVAINPTLDGSSAMPYAIDRPEGNLSLKEMVEVAIANLEDRPKKALGQGERPGSQRLLPDGRGRQDRLGMPRQRRRRHIGDMLDFDAAVAVASSSRVGIRTKH
jgi:alkaline phosphatase